VVVFREPPNSWLTFGHLMFPAQRFAFLRALRFETTEWENVSELQHSDHFALCFVSQQRPRRDF